MSDEMAEIRKKAAALDWLEENRNELIIATPYVNAGKSKTLHDKWSVWLKLPNHPMEWFKPTSAPTLLETIAKAREEQE